MHDLKEAAWAQVFAWGCNSSGQLGVGDTAARRSPAAVEALWAMPVRSPCAPGSDKDCFFMT